MHPRLPEEMRDFARSLRAHQTDAEKLLWMLLRNRQLGGYKFRRQHRVGCFIVDFYCRESGLGIELDGGQHNEDETAVKDEIRSEVVARSGIQVIRFWNHDVLRNTEAVLEKIYNCLVRSGTGPHPCPSPGGRGDIDKR